MSYFSHSPGRTSLRPRWFSVTTLFLLGCILVFSSCSETDNTHNKPFAYRTSSVSTLLQEQSKLQMETLQQWVALMQQYHGDTTSYQKDVLSDQKALHAAQTDSAYQQVLDKLNQQVKNIELPALKNEASTLEKQLAQESTAWGQKHTYHDSYNDTTYPLAYEYGSNGVDGFVQDDLSNARTVSDYQQAVEDADMYLTNFHAYEANASDKTSWKQAHATDLQLLKHYNALNQKVVVISLGEETMRVYQNGHLVKAFQVTTGQPAKPSLPGDWSVEEKQSPTVFRSDEPKSSPYWYPDTPINYAMLYHSGGYYLHDSWWRDDYGFGTQFPHADSSGDSFSYTGSHGCINIQESNAAWLYSFVDVNTPVIIY